MLRFKIPSEDPDLPPDGKQQRLLHNDFPISCNLTQSSGFKLYQVQYTLKVFVKHDVFSQRGEGEGVTIPIRILEKPNDLRPEKSNYYKDANGLIELGQRPTYDLVIDEETKAYKEQYLVAFEAQWLKNVIAGAVATLIDNKPKNESKLGGAVTVKDPIRLVWQKFVPVGDLMDEDALFNFYDELKVDPSSDLVVFAISYIMQAQLMNQYRWVEFERVSNKLEAFTIDDWHKNVVSAL